MPSTRLVGSLAFLGLLVGLGVGVPSQTPSLAEEAEVGNRSRDSVPGPPTANRGQTWSQPPADLQAPLSFAATDGVRRAAFETAESAPSADPKATPDGRPVRQPAESGPAERGNKRGSTSDSPNAPIPLPLPSRPDRNTSVGPTAPQNGFRAAVTVAGSLAGVLGLFFLFAWVMRRGMPGAIGLLPREALEVLGRAPLAGRQQVHLVRLGSKLVLISVTPAGAEALSEVTEPDEVQRLVGLCRQGQSASATSMFRQALERFGGETGGKGFWAGGGETAGSGLGLRSGRIEGQEDQDDG